MSNDENMSLLSEQGIKEIQRTEAMLRKALSQFNKSFKLQKFIGSSLGGLIKVAVGGNGRLRQVYIDEELLAKGVDGKEEIEAGIIDSVDSAIDSLETSKDAQAEILAKQLNIPLDQIMDRVRGVR